MSITYSHLQESVEQYFQGLQAERKRAVAILNAIKERFIAREVPEDNIWFQVPDTEDEEDGKPNKRTVTGALDLFPTATEKKWKVDLVIHVQINAISSTTFYNEISVKFDSPNGTAHLFAGDDEIAKTELNSSPLNQAELARFCDAIFERMMSSGEPQSGQYRKIGFQQ